MSNLASGCSGSKFSIRNRGFFVQGGKGWNLFTHFPPSVLRLGKNLTFHQLPIGQMISEFYQMVVSKFYQMVNITWSNYVIRCQLTFD